ncbi:hypothetical protein NE848_12015 [Gramella jeungdoensis]|uniref:STAS/SEC14 domain-containing protein n=1 Tax=Gramella jeungdoensis TaxID=708091 RepID=A0ABT0Z2Z0_9FLAO|nr:hypothetical protein [Gramella jeungdoensis]MCM8570108.1 hypothetical protein [Gramella jeungdoensis]
MKKSVVDIVPYDQIKKIHSLDYGNFFFLENAIVAEVAEGITYDWSKGKKIIDLGLEFYGPFSSVHYISNRINDYSVRPQDWKKFSKYQKHLKTYTVVTYGKIGFTNLVFERIFFPCNINHFHDLEKALDFINEYDKRLNEKM